MPQVPLIMTSQGLQPQAPADLRAQLITMVAATNPDYTANLPGSLVEDISSTDTYATVQSDSFLVDLVNSVTPYGANAFLLAQLGAMLGVDPQPVVNTSVMVIFFGPPGYVIAQGFTVSDGTYQYVCQDGGICGVDGNSLPIYAVATVPGAWPVPPNTVSQMITSVPDDVPGGLGVNNPIDGIPSTQGESVWFYRERVWAANLASSTGTSRYLKTLLGNIPGVQFRLVSVVQVPSGYNVIVGGGDPYQVAFAIWEAAFYIPALQGAVINIDAVSNTNPCVITTANKHHLTTGDVEMISGIVGFPYLNWQKYSVTVIDEWRFSVPVDATQWGAYQYGGTVTPNPINEFVTITDYPDTFTVPFIIPPQETVLLQLMWETNSPNAVSPDAIAQYSVPVLIDYINSLPAGITPINLNVMTKLFLEAIDPILDSELIIDIQYTVSINGIGVSTSPGTQVIWGDPYSFFYTDNSLLTVVEHP